MLIVILGPDGSGKTTISLEIESAINSDSNLRCRLFAQRYGLFPTLNDLLRLNFSKKIRVDDLEFHQDESIVNTPLRSMLHLFYYGLEYIIGNIYYRSDVKSEFSIFLFGRYFYDFYFQRNHSRLSNRLIKLVEKVIPKPDMVFILKRDAANIYDTKPELPVEEIQRQQGVLSNLAFNNTVCYQIDCNGPIHTSVKICLDLIKDRSKYD